VQFTTVMEFVSLDDVISFQGKDYEASYVPPEASRVLKRWDERSTHRDVRQVRHYFARLSHRFFVDKCLGRNGASTKVRFHGNGGDSTANIARSDDPDFHAAS
jgi:hypothetical protein